MSCLYVCEQGATIGYESYRFQVKLNGKVIQSVPGETVETIYLFGKIQLTTQCITECLQRGVNVVFYSSFGSYYGRLISTNHVNVERQRLQASLSSDFKLEIVKNIIQAKIHNQAVILQRYSRYNIANIDDKISFLLLLSRKISSCETTESIMGYEGIAAKNYFYALGKLINPDFKFSKRSRRPPLDPFNSMISLGYSIILNEIYGKIEGKGLNPYFGIMHKDKEKHPTLASDLMEEWRPVIVDSLTMSLLNGHELTIEDFYSVENRPGIFITNTGFRTYISKLENKLWTSNKYLTGIDYPVTFRQAMDLQVNSFCKAIKKNSPSIYKAIQIR